MTCRSETVAACSFWPTVLEIAFLCFPRLPWFLLYMTRRWCDDSWAEKFVSSARTRPSPAKTEELREIQIAGDWLRRVVRATPMMKLSLIVSVLESYEVVRRQLLHLERLLTPECELMLVDDGSSPSLQLTFDSVRKTFRCFLH